MDTQPNVQKSRRLPRQLKGGVPLLLSRPIANLVLSCCEALLNSAIKVPFTDGTNILVMKDGEIKITELGAVMTLPPIPLPGSGNSNNVPYSGFGPPSSSTLSSSFTYYDSPYPSLYVDMGVPALYVCTTGGSNSSSVWTLISSGSGSSGLAMFKIQSDGGDFWVCRTWDGANLGLIDVLVNKPSLIKAGSAAPSSRTIRGTTYNYSYVDAGGYFIRTSTVGGSVVERCCIDPDPLNGDVICALPDPSTTIPFHFLGSVAINSAGTGYVSGDIGKILTVSGGTGTAAQLQITAVSGGHVTGVSFVDVGYYSVLPTMSGAAVTGSTTGSGATFDFTEGQLYVDINIDSRAWAEM